MSTSTSAPTRFRRVDRGQEFGRSAQESWKTLGWLDRIRLVLTMLGFMFFMALPRKLMSKLGLVKRRNGPIVQVTSGLWQLTFDDGTCNSTIIKGQDGTLLMVLAARPEADTLAAISKLGKVSAVLFLDEAHETFADEFVAGLTKAQGSAPEVVCPARAEKSSRGRWT